MKQTHDTRTNERNVTLSNGSFVLFAFFARLRLVRIVNLYDPGSVLVIYNNLCSFLIYDVSANLTRNDGFRIFAA
jgi:hypothetical protein